MKKKCIMICMIVAVIFSSLSVFAITFTDLEKTHWAYSDIMELAQKKVINGYLEGSYKPEGTVTKGEFFKLVAVTIEDEEKIKEHYSMFATLTKSWAMPYAMFLNDQMCLMEGTNLRNLDEEITRLEMAVVLAKVNIFYKLNDIDSDSTSITLTDLEGLTEENRNYIEMTIDKGLIKGFEDKTFRPDSYMTRAQVATVIKRLVDRL